MPDPAPIPVPTPDLETQKKELDGKLAEALLTKSMRRRVHLPPAPLSIDLSLGFAAGIPDQPDDISRMFDEYFSHARSSVVLASSTGSGLPSPPALRECRYGETLPHWSACFKPAGRRGSLRNQAREVHSLFSGDVLWLFYMERMGVFELLGALLDDYALRGKLALANNTPASYLLEQWTRDTISGGATSMRRRQVAYGRALGWASKKGRDLGVEATPNTAWNRLFHELVFHALEYFRDFRLAHAIRGASTSASASVATFTTLRDTMQLLQTASDPMSYGRVYSATLEGIVGVLASLTLVRDLRGEIGVPANFSRIDQYVAASWETLVAGKTGAPSGINRYTAHRECATYGRNILLQLEVLDLENRAEVELWLTLVEDQFEGYRTAYRTLTGVDLGASSNPAVEQAL